MVPSCQLLLLRSAAGYTHMTCHGRIRAVPVYDEIMALWFARDRLVYSLPQGVVVSRGPHGCAQVGGIVLT